MPGPEDVANDLLLQHGIAEAPVDVEKLAVTLGCVVSRSPFSDDDVSGILLRDGEKTIIGLNETQSDRRQRFTIAHEIGHFVMHPGQPVILERLIRVDRRDGLSSQATDRHEIQANQFAAALLMPRDLVLAEFRRLVGVRPDISDDDTIYELANRFQVSGQAMGFRLRNVGVLPAY